MPRRSRPATSARLALGCVRSSISHTSIVIGIAILCTASVLLSLTTRSDVSLLDVGGLVKDRSVASSGGLPAARTQNDRLPSSLFQERPLVLLTLSYHAAPIYDLMDQLQPLGVQFIERGINAYACRYFNTCRQDGFLEACFLVILLLRAAQYSAK